MSQQKSVLGKGLASLFPGATRVPNPAGIPPLPPTEAEQSAQQESPPEAGPASSEVRLDLASAPSGATVTEWEVKSNAEIAPQAAAVSEPAAETSAAPVVIPATAQANATSVRGDRMPGISFADPSEIQVNPYQPRRDFPEKELEELSQSIRENGVIQPLIVRKTEDGYQLIAGERRLRASKLAGLTRVPIVIRRSTDKESLELALIENIQRQDLNCIDEALAYFQLIQDFTLTQEEIAKRVGKERATVANHLRLLRLPEAVIEDLKKGALTFGHGKALLGVEEADERLRLHKKVIEEQLSVRETENLVQELKERAAQAALAQKDGKAPDAQGAQDTPLVARLRSLSHDLTRQWGTKVEIRGQGKFADKRGKIVLHYHTREELERLLTALQSQAQN